MIRLWISLEIFKVFGFVVEQIPTTGTPPPSVIFSRLAYAGESLFSFGGMFEKEYTNEMWEYSFLDLNWTKLSPGSQDSPSPRILPVFTSAFDTLLLFGGQTDLGANGDFWSYNITTNLWQQIKQLGNIPSARTQSAFTVIENQTLFMYGGNTIKSVDSALYK